MADTLGFGTRALGKQVSVDMRDVRRAFKRIDPVLQEFVGGASKETADLVARFARFLVPVRYGNLRKFIVSSYSKKSGTARAYVKKGSVTIPAGAAFGHGGRTVHPSFYGRLVHQGTSRSRGTPFMLIAAQQQRGPYAQRVKEAIGRAARQLNTEASQSKVAA